MDISEPVTGPGLGGAEPGPPLGSSAPGQSGPPGEGPTSERIDVWFAPNGKQRRWTVLLRAILVLPHVVILYFLSLVAAVIAILGWFGALFSGRLPDFAVDFLSGVLRWHNRVTAYQLLLVDRYPPFSLGDAPRYPVQLAIRPGPLNRLAVLFRIFLVIPGLVVSDIAISGASLLAIVGWVIALVTGRLPDAFHRGFASVTRLWARYLGYFGMLSSQYPWWDLFGDVPPPGVVVPTDPAAAEGQVPPAHQVPPPASVPPAPAVPPAPPVVPAAGTTESATVDVPTPAPAPATPAPSTGEPPGVPGPEWASPVAVTGGDLGLPPPTNGGAKPSSSPPPRSTGWPLMLDGAARAVVIVAILLGVLLTVGGATYGASNAAKGASAAAARRESLKAYDTLHAGLTAYSSGVSACTSLACVRQQSLAAAEDLTTFADAIDGIAYPSEATGAADAVVKAAHQTAAAFDRQAHLTSLSQFFALQVRSSVRFEITREQFAGLINELDSL